MTHFKKDNMAVLECSKNDYRIDKRKLLEFKFRFVWHGKKPDSPARFGFKWSTKYSMSTTVNGDFVSFLICQSDEETFKTTNINDLYSIRELIKESLKNTSHIRVINRNSLWRWIFEQLPFTNARYYEVTTRFGEWFTNTESLNGIWSDFDLFDKDGTVVAASYQRVYVKRLLKHINKTIKRHETWKD